MRLYKPASTYQEYWTAPAGANEFCYLLTTGDTFAANPKIPSVLIFSVLSAQLRLLLRIPWSTTQPQWVRPIGVAPA